jgi:CRISPR-associated protein Csd1
MILQELSQFYNKLMSNPDIDICEPGFSMENISFKIKISEDGSLFDPENPIEDLRDSEKKPKKIRVPKFDGKRASGIKPYFLWDKTDYIIGIKKDNDLNEIKTDKHHQAFLRLIDMVESAVDKTHKEVNAVRSFCLSENNITFLRNSPHWNDFLNSFIIFEIVGSGYSNIFENQDIINIWLEYYEKHAGKSDNLNGLCLVSGKTSKLARLHPTIKRGVGGKNDIPMISCNFDSAESYGKKKNENAQISAFSASAIAGALNYLVENRKHNLLIADTRILFWAESNNKFEEIFDQIFSGPGDDGYSKDLLSFFTSLQLGILPDPVNDSSRFFILGLAPNAARISVRFWIVDSVNNMSLKIGKHFSDLNLIKERENNVSYPSVRQLILELAKLHKSENIPHNITAPVIQSIINATNYPLKLLSILLSRMRSDQKYDRLNYYRASFIKAILNRNYKKEITMSLDPDRKTVPYLLGRLFSVIEKVQEESAAGSLNTTIKDRYFASASTTPQAVFPRLFSLHQNHMKKLKSEKTGLAVTREKMMGEVISGLPASLPSTLKLDEQGEFSIGYYHQRQDFFTKKEEQPE